MNRNMDEYLRRNLVHAKSVGVEAGIWQALSIIKDWKRPHKGLVKLLTTELEKMTDIRKELAQHREEVK